MASLSSARRIVVKIGSALLVDAAEGGLRSNWLASLAKDIIDLRQSGKDVVIVSSGSIALGRGALGLPAGALTLEQSQAAAAVGQIKLARAYEENLSPLKTAQVLLTLEDSMNRRRYLNSRSTLSTLIDLGAIPIVNENDTVATDEIKFGDNDRLAAQVSAMIGADVLVLLSDVDGLYSANPKQDENAIHFPKITEITPEIEAMAGEAGTDLAKGGMKTKLMAAKIAMQGGVAMAISKGDVLGPMSALSRGATASWFIPKEGPSAARKQWIASMNPKARLIIDKGASAALLGGKSLLAVGIQSFEGTFERGDPVFIQNECGENFGIGLVSYSSEEAIKILGKQTRDISDILGYPGRAAMVHRDNLVM